MVLSGDFIGDVCDVSLEVIGKTKEYPVANIFFTVHKGLQGGTWKDVANVKVRKMYFLTTEPVTQGVHAGKTRLQVIRETFASVFGYDGPLHEETMKAAMLGKSARLVCEAKKTDRGEVTEVKWVNPVNSDGNTNKRAIPANLLAALDKQFSGGKAASVAAPSFDWAGQAT